MLDENVKIIIPGEAHKPMIVNSPLRIQKIDMILVKMVINW